MKTMPVRIPKDLVKELKKRKTHPRETYGDVIRRLLEEKRESKEAKTK